MNITLTKISDGTSYAIFPTSKEADHIAQASGLPLATPTSFKADDLRLFLEMKMNVSKQAVKALRANWLLLDAALTKSVSPKCWGYFSVDGTHTLGKLTLRAWETAKNHTADTMDADYFTFLANHFLLGNMVQDALKDVHGLVDLACKKGEYPSSWSPLERQNARDYGSQALHLWTETSAPSLKVAA
jgi:hypothetical protein